MREPPMLNVEIDGQAVRRAGELEVLLYDREGKPAVSRIRPQLLPGEALVERAGRIPVVIRTSA